MPEKKKVPMKSTLPKLLQILPQILTVAGESALLSIVGAKRQTYYVCNNPECPFCYNGTPMNLIKRPLSGVGVGEAQKRLDIGGITTMLQRSAYRAKNIESYDPKKHGPARYGKCPVCGYPLAQEMIPGPAFKPDKK